MAVSQLISSFKHFDCRATNCMGPLPSLYFRPNLHGIPGTSDIWFTSDFQPRNKKWPAYRRETPINSGEKVDSRDLKAKVDAHKELRSGRSTRIDRQASAVEVRKTTIRTSPGRRSAAHEELEARSGLIEGFLRPRIDVNGPGTESD